MTNPAISKDTRNELIGNRIFAIENAPIENIRYSSNSFKELWNNDNQKIIKQGNDAERALRLLNDISRNTVKKNSDRFFSLCYGLKIIQKFYQYYFL